MDQLTPYVLSDFMLRLPPKDLYKWLVIGHYNLVDEYFWRRFCISRKIVFGPLPWEKRASLWMQRKPVWTQIDDTPWDSASQGPKTIWGYAESSVIEYVSSEIADGLIIADLGDAIARSQENGLFITKFTGYYQTLVDANENSKIIYFIIYTPYDKLRVGWYDGKSWCIDDMTHYWGSTKSGLRQGHGVALFDTGFVIDRDWIDHNMVSYHQQEPMDFPAVSINMIEELEKILNSYIGWCNVTGYV
jgi:hypothetical protein